MSRDWVAGLRVAAVASLSRLEWWPLALAGFLVRGGVILVLLPIVSLPSLTEVASAIGPIAVVFGIGQPSAGVLFGVAISVVALVLLILAACAGGAWLDLVLLREIGEDDEVDLPVTGLGAPIGRAVLARLLAHLGTTIALAYATVRLGYATYDTVLSTGDGGSLVARVLAAAPDAPFVLVVAWLVGEAAGGIAVRRIAAGAHVLGALGLAARSVLRPRILLTMLLTNAVLVGVGLPFWLAASRSWIHLRAYLLEGAPFPFLAAALLLLGAVWVLGLGLLALVLTWRQVAWTTAVFPRRLAEAAAEGAVEAAKA